MKLLAKKYGRRDGIGKRALLRPDNLRIADIDAGGMPLPNMANRQHPRDLDCGELVSIRPRCRGNGVNNDT
ncbi:Uncharacterised protein [Suttonella indologenes]|uniref:Uncharacterized protein n=1 Tax=Suttonella indologenes TaxID=13276 RepID=A0A380MYQ8_9GAMM|nr:Uncharacterised protein [Suttonella indologenes]